MSSLLNFTGFGEDCVYKKTTWTNLVKRVRVYMKLYSLYYNQRSQQGHFWGTDHDHHANVASLKVLISPRTTREPFQEKGGRWCPPAPYFGNNCPELRYFRPKRVVKSTEYFRDSPLTPLLGTSLTLKPLELYAARTSLQFFNFCSAVPDTASTASGHTIHSTSSVFMLCQSQAQKN